MSRLFRASLWMFAVGVGLVLSACGGTNAPSASGTPMMVAVPKALQAQAIGGTGYTLRIDVVVDGASTYTLEKDEELPDGIYKGKLNLDLSVGSHSLVLKYYLEAAGGNAVLVAHTPESIVVSVEKDQTAVADFSARPLEYDDQDGDRFSNMAELLRLGGDYRNPLAVPAPRLSIEVRGFSRAAGGVLTVQEATLGNLTFNDNGAKVFSGEPPFGGTYRLTLAASGYVCAFSSGQTTDSGAMTQDRTQTVNCTARGVRVFQDPLAGGGFGPTMVVLPEGSFVRGVGTTLQQQVTLARSFAISQTEVTFEEYDRFAVATGRSLPADIGGGRGNRPVINVTWQDAAAYAEWISAETRAKYRLPTEAEWEYAAGAGTTTTYWWGASATHNDANYGTDTCCSGLAVEGTQDKWVNTAPVRSFSANPFGLYDTAGNVWERVQDCWHENYTGAPTNGSAWESANGGDCARRVLRGGSWIDKGESTRTAFRYRNLAEDRDETVGFRLARDL